MTNSIQQKNFSNCLKQCNKPENLPPPSPLFLETGDELDNLDYRFEAVRLKSFKNWPLPFMKPRILAAAGFYYVGEIDRVRCFECNIEIYRWEQGDIPMVDHERSSPRCRFVRNIPCGNVPIGTDPASVIPPSPRSQDVCGIYDIENLPESDQEYNEALHFPKNKLRSLGIERPRPPVYPEYVSIESRIRSFDTWPKSLPPDKKRLAEAGFFYTGKEDQTLCFHCGGGLKDWVPEDDPWDQHCKWFSKCHYLLMAKGKEYVNAVTGQRVTSPSKEETLNMKLLPFMKKVEQTSIGEISEKTNLENNPSSSVGSNNNGIGSLSADLSGSMTENKYEKDGRLCKICYNVEMGIVFLPCKHMVACVNCASLLTSCPICRQKIDLVISAILS